MYITRRNALAAAVTLLFAGAASAAPTITNVDYPLGFNPWTGFDLSSGSTALITNFTGDGANFQLEAWGTVEALKTTGNANIPSPGLDTGLGDTGTYEYTYRVMLNETATCATPASCTFNISSGSFVFYYDDFLGGGVQGDYVSGAGITDGVVAFSGTVAPQLGGSFTLTSPGNGVGVAPVVGGVNFTNLALIDPALASATTVATLQLGSFETGNWLLPTGTPGAGGVSLALTGDPSSTDGSDGSVYFATQIDGNVGITMVPEPGTLALLGLAMGGLGLIRRSKTA